MMNDELHECRSAFSGRKGDIDANIALQTHDGAQLLLIQLRNEAKMDFFQLKVDRNYLTDNPEMAFCFETPEDLFYTLMELFNDVTISEDGVLTFEMKLNASKLKKKVFRLAVERQKIEPGEMGRLKLEAMRKEFKTLLAGKDQRIEELTRTGTELGARVAALEEEVSELRREGEELALEGRKKDFRLGSLAKEGELQRQEMAVLRKSLEEFHKKVGLLELYHFLDNPHWHNFAVHRSQAGVVVVKKHGDALWHSFLRNLPLTPAKTHHFALRQLKTSYRNIMVGICTRDCFGVAYAYKSKSSLAYNSYSGNVWERGSSRRGGNPLLDGQTLALEVDLADHRIAWLIDGKKAAEAAIGEELKGKEVFLSLQFYNTEDELELINY